MRKPKPAGRAISIGLLNPTQSQNTGMGIYAYVTLNSYTAMFDTQHWGVFHVLSSDTMAIGGVFAMLYGTN